MLRRFEPGLGARSWEGQDSRAASGWEKGHSLCPERTQLCGPGALRPLHRDRAKDARSLSPDPHGVAAQNPAEPSAFATTAAETALSGDSWGPGAPSSAQLGSGPTRGALQTRDDGFLSTAPNPFLSLRPETGIPRRALGFWSLLQLWQPPRGTALPHAEALGRCGRRAGRGMAGLPAQSRPSMARSSPVASG